MLLLLKVSSINLLKESIKYELTVLAVASSDWATRVTIHDPPLGIAQELFCSTFKTFDSSNKMAISSFMSYSLLETSRSIEAGSSGVHCICTTSFVFLPLTNVLTPSFSRISSVLLITITVSFFFLFIKAYVMYIETRYHSLICIVHHICSYGGYFSLT